MCKKEPAPMQPITGAGGLIPPNNEPSIFKFSISSIRQLLNIPYWNVVQPNEFFVGASLAFVVTEGEYGWEKPNGGTSPTSSGCS